jgi:CBS domain-containing protein
MTAIESLMATEMVTVAPDDRVAEAARRMQRNRVGAVLVVVDGKPAGLFSERDLLTRVVAENRDPATTHVGEVSTPEPVCIEATDSLRSVLDAFRQHRFRHLPVTRGGQAVGILSTRDFLAFVVEGLERHIERARYDQSIAAGADPYDHFGGSYGK